jgi:Amt family ammonium transporter
MPQLNRVAIDTVWVLLAAFLVFFMQAGFGMIMNGALAGLVAITAPCAFVDPWAAIAIGAIGGVIVVLGVMLLDKLRIDDPVGAVPVHGLNGVWGTLSIGLFGRKALDIANDGLFYGGGMKQLGIQALGVMSVVVFVLLIMGILFKLIDLSIGLRVSREEELAGLDSSEHGMESYAGFQIQ